MSEPIRLAVVPKDVATSTSLSLGARLERRFGLGAMPGKRRALYARLELIVENNPSAEALIREAAAQATGKNHPDRYFCRAVSLKLRECGAYPDV